MKHVSLTAAFSDIRNYLAGRAVGITRDKALLHEVVKCLFCKMNFVGETFQKQEEEILREYKQAFDRVKVATHEIFDLDEEIALDAGSVSYVDKVLSRVDLIDPHNDPLSDLYQAFIGSEVRGDEGQFFTPTEAVKWLTQAVSPTAGERIIDPACGAGSFLSFSARHLRAMGTGAEEINQSLYGIEKDRYLATLAKTHIALTTVKSSNVICADSIEKRTNQGEAIPFEINGTFDVVFANPPFGAKIRMGSEAARASFELGYKWKRDKATRRFVKTDVLAANPSPQILFLELCIKLLRPGGRLGIVVPESMISNSSSGYVVQYLLDNAVIKAVIGMPENLFKTSGKGGTHTKTCLVVAERRSLAKGDETSQMPIFMAEAKWCGHDSRGNIIPHNDLPLILQGYLHGKAADRKTSRLGYFVSQDKLVDNILAPRYYDPSSDQLLKALEHSHDLLCIKDLVDSGVLEFSTGDEIGKLAYGTGDIPFIRTSDISNWEIKTDHKHGISKEIYDKYAKKQDVQEGDILMVRDGTYLIGTCAYISKYNTTMLYQSHIYKIRVRKPEVISPYLLLAALSCKQVVSKIQSKRFTQDIIDTLGQRVLELVLPIPKNKKVRNEIESTVRQSIHDRIEARELARKATLMISEGTMALATTVDLDEPDFMLYDAPADALDLPT